MTVNHFLYNIFTNSCVFCITFLYNCFKHKNMILAEPIPVQGRRYLIRLMFVLYRRECGWLWWGLQRVGGRDVRRVTERLSPPPHRHPQRARRVGRQQGLLHLQPHGQVTGPCQHVQVPGYGSFSFIELYDFMSLKSTFKWTTEMMSRSQYV